VSGPVLTNADFDTNVTQNCGYGVSNESAAKALRKLADALERNTAQVERAHIVHRVLPDEFHSTTLVLSWNH
jgi:hypothetical protein